MNEIWTGLAEQRDAMLAESRAREAEESDG